MGESSSGLLKSATSPAAADAPVNKLRASAVIAVAAHPKKRSWLMNTDFTRSEAIIARGWRAMIYHSRWLGAYLALASSAPAGTLSAGRMRHSAPTGLAFGPLSSV